MTISTQSVSPSADGVVLIDPEYFNKEGKKDRKGDNDRREGVGSLEYPHASNMIQE